MDSMVFYDVGLAYQALQRVSVVGPGVASHSDRGGYRRL